MLLNSKNNFKIKYFLQYFRKYFASAYICNAAGVSQAALFTAPEDLIVSGLKAHRIWRY